MNRFVTSEDILAAFLLLFGLGFFSVIMWFVITHTTSEEREKYTRKLNEIREFGRLVTQTQEEDTTPKHRR